MPTEINNRTLVIAEAGVNHNGNEDVAFNLIDAAIDAGADIIKFQTFKADSLVTKNAMKAQYQIENTSGRYISKLFSNLLHPVRKYIENTIEDIQTLDFFDVYLFIVFP